jgi:hypothetical protein
MSTPSTRSGACASTLVALLATFNACQRRVDPAPAVDPTPELAPDASDEPPMKGECARGACIQWIDDDGGPIGVTETWRPPRNKFCTLRHRQPKRKGEKGETDLWIPLLEAGDTFYMDGKLMKVEACEHRYDQEASGIHLVLEVLVGAEAACSAGQCGKPAQWLEHQ